jgi:hypothetical protein
VDATGVDATMISGHTEITSPGTDDTLLIKDKAAGVNKSLQIQNLYKTVSGLTALSSADIANPDEFLVLDGGIPKKITKANLETATLTSVNNLAALTSATVADDDVLLVYDTSTSSAKKIAKSDLVADGITYAAKAAVTRDTSGNTTLASGSFNISSVSSSRTAGGGGTGYMYFTINFTDPVGDSLPLLYSSSGVQFNVESRSSSSIVFKSTVAVTVVAATIYVHIFS